MITPIIGVLLLLCVTLIISYYTFRFRCYKWMILVGIVHICMSPLLTISIGSLIVGLGILQTYMGFLNSKKRMKAIRHE